MFSKKMIVLLIAVAVIAIAGAITQGFSATTLDFQKMKSLHGLASCFCGVNNYPCSYCFDLSDYGSSGSSFCTWSVQIKTCIPGDAWENCACASKNTNCGVYYWCTGNDCAVCEPGGGCSGCTTLTTSTDMC